MAVIAKKLFACFKPVAKKLEPMAGSKAIGSDVNVLVCYNVALLGLGSILCCLFFFSSFFGAFFLVTLETFPKCADAFT